MFFHFIFIINRFNNRIKKTIHSQQHQEVYRVYDNCHLKKIRLTDEKETISWRGGITKKPTKFTLNKTTNLREILKEKETNRRGHLLHQKSKTFCYFKLLACHRLGHSNKQQTEKQKNQKSQRGKYKEKEKSIRTQITLEKVFQSI